ncbi:MAG: Thiaminase II involved in salvage of thiamin pyrimidine moiety, TenA subgroup with Cys in active site [uncultured Pseudonocardia sp.]|uniref:Thiaminase II involved in salvage of thiamin pyrimidine moiety, TenA subgroup with Cys in active site n=1 Tax=uncultured Pseudonocardia sp. TaxID=211455 RepID=A0A6J4Q8D7_9PSEU|nr:MAG: Thiaminase II involved in salvage of thiamin pyrimidine moiety, TenA subgroup with Cys in active site [uncultured Pseudonocardia sp.]
MSLTEELWRSAAPVYEAILVHPFLTGLTRGTLAPEAFAFYLGQDALYLQRYGEALAVLAERSPEPGDATMFARHAAGAIAVERHLHESLLPQLGIDPAALAGLEPAPTTLAYTSYLLATVHGAPYAEGVAAVLPCYWIYREVGAELRHRGSPDARYRAWIDTYGGEEFGADVQEVLDLTDRLGTALGPDERARARRHFQVASRYEWMFWDMGLRREAWPV